ncbi:MAG: bifunctional diaminohydroxyphosphoribosylaminopyrimidine deaminase/5-amino-6-(5-phosphoribosylamino)uracil reductase RibD [Comamonas sp.]
MHDEQEVGSDEQSPWMRRALELAQDALYRTSPNPRVGCVLVNAAGQMIGEGATQQVGGPHAEVMALRDAARRGHRVQGATAYVTLEPCAHTGRTGPCCEALARAGVARVVASLQDPNPQVAGHGLAHLRAAGVQVDVGLGAAQSRELNLGFMSRMVRKQPWVRMKVAASLDGKTALGNGVSQWITSSDARSDGHAWRARSCAILTGVGTVLADNPRLDVRDVLTERQPKLVIVDSHLRTPADAAIFKAPRAVLIYALNINQPQADELRAQGALLIEAPRDGQGRIDLAFVMQDLAKAQEINELHVEAGETLNGALLNASLVDELLAYVAPKLLGPGKEWALLPSLQRLDQSIDMEFHAIDRVGVDLRVLARIKGRDQF